MRRSLAKTLVLLAICGLAGYLANSAGPSQEVKFGIGDWDPESGLGNHRAVVRVGSLSIESIPPQEGQKEKTLTETGETKPSASAVWAHIPWRRRDHDPEKKNILVIDALSGEKVRNVFPVSITRESGDIIFEPKTGPGNYYVYYLPYQSEGRRNYPTVKYSPPDFAASPEWLAANGLDEETRTALKAENFPHAEVVRIQAVDELNSFYPMEVVASGDEIRAFLDDHPGAAYFLFPESRENSIRMTDDLPFHWIAGGPKDVFKGRAARGEYFAFQIGVWAARARLEELEVQFSDLTLATSSPPSGSPGKRRSIPSTAAACINTGGINWDGSPLRKVLAVEKGKIQALWCGVRIPGFAKPGIYTGLATLTAKGHPSSSIRLEIEITDEFLRDAGDGDPFRMTRLRWLNSRLAFDDDIVPPFTPMKVKGLAFSCLGRTLSVGSDGLPAEIHSTFSPEMTRLRSKGVDFLAAPVRLRVHDQEKKELVWTPREGGPGIIKQTPGAVAWEVVNHTEGLNMTVDAQMEFDGFVQYHITLTAERDITVSDIWLEMPIIPEQARYMMGLGFKGGERPQSFDWSWDREKNQDALWIGTVHAGVQVSLRAENYSRPLNTNFYLSKPLNLPPSWWNGGRGVVTVRTGGQAPVGKKSKNLGPDTVYLRAHSGLRTIKAGESLHFDFNLLLTPFKLLDPSGHFSQRYFHAYKPLDEVAAAGANVINIHHANEINPFINYPFLRPERMKAYIDDAHRRGFKVKIYNTIRELSNRAPELFALRSLGHEIFSSGPGGGYSWLQEHVGGDYIAAWFVPDLKDAAMINSGMSRWHNYYIEGLDWLARNVGIDGLYLDDVAFDRTTMKRVRKVLDRNRHGVLIDLHSANQYNPRDGFASSANLYLEHFPFLNRLWFGEYFDYDGSGPDYWLVELSGIPFGLMGEMLQDGGNPWRGMVFGMTSRLPWAGNPRPLWKVWDEFGITESEMIGWWVDGKPVRTGNQEILSTVYLKKTTKKQRKKGEKTSALIALASWAEEPVEIKLRIEWKELGLDPTAAVLSAPAIENFQPAAVFKADDAIRVEPGKGWILILREN